MSSDQENIQLLKDIAAGSRQAFDIFYEKYISFVYQIAFSIVHNHAEAEDICHDVFLEVYQKARQYSEEKGSIKAWLAVKTKSRSLDRLRKNKDLLIHRLENLSESKKMEPGADLQFLHSLEKHLIIEALKAIPIEQREAIIRSYYNGETHNEIAITMKKPLGSVKSLIRYGLNNLRKQKALMQWVGIDRGEKK
ncbi:RNA polymerase sigma factor [Caldifermentibacillus hisashii]|uniref:RNA polymerase sigma factor n=1 Tax=Caldifermentibacillus hisashii TaxID=996558 RepID=UPI001C10E474|nr:sigma-70 family RNA polymerase sigma factor [Caldifermentibacillus hisashii]MBU5342357.1 sigma-70 family RNA polymerase sigma factor [Caldifermentibacillus hisashii]